MRRSRLFACGMVLLLLSSRLLPAQAADAPRVRLLRTQQVGDARYFHVSLEFPKDMARDDGEGLPPPARLVPQDGKAQGVYVRLSADAVFMAAGGLFGRVRAMPPGEFPMEKPDAPLPAPRAPAPIEELEFVGKVTGDGPAQFLLVYPRERRRDRFRERLGPLFMRSRPPLAWAETPVTLDFSTAQKVAAPAEAKERKGRAGRRQPPEPAGRRFDKAPTVFPRPPDAPAEPTRPRAAVPSLQEIPAPLAPGEVQSGPQSPVRDDLEGLWAAAQADHMAMLAGQVTDFGFYSFASAATARKYGVGNPEPAARFSRDRFGRFDGGPDMLDRELYETTTGATAVAESLQLRRMLGQSGRDDGPREVDIRNVQGIDISEHPWESMMAGKRPAAEPLARLTPNDNYYIHFKNIRQFIEFGELLDQWGTNLIRAYEVTSRDYRLKERYEKQLCLRSTWMGKTLGPAVIRSLAITGNDAYLREGSDLTVLFHVHNRKLFLAGVEQFLQEARKEFGKQLHEAKADYQGVAIETYATPLREVSLHRAMFDEFVVYSNSPAALRRVIDTHQGRHKALADSLDFQYMRTVFRLDDPEESGFAFLSDPFIRQLVGPASKIKEKRRLEALTSLYMLTHGALFTGWETGKLPSSHKALLEATALQPEEVYTPEGKPPAWDSTRQIAISDVYNALHFATPLVELPIDKVTAREAQEYSQFRQEYLGLWRNYFDPIGMRIGLTDSRVKIDTYILPLIQNSSYNQLRRVTGDGTLSLDLGGFSPKTLVQLTMHLSPNIGDRRELLFSPLRSPGRGREEGSELLELLAWGLDPVGKWLLIRLDDSPVYGRLMKLMDDEGPGPDGEEAARLVFQIPLVVGIDIRNPMTFAGVVAALRMNVMKALPGGMTWEPMEPEYKGVSITRVQATPAGRNRLMGPRGGVRQPFLPAVYYAMIDGGFYLSLNEEPLKDLIDRHVAQSEARRDGKADTVEVNSSLYIAPGAAEKTRDMIHKYLERQTHERALANAPVWHVLYRAGVMKSDAVAPVGRLTDAGETAKPSEGGQPVAPVADATAQRYLGFIPVSPDGTAYAYEPKIDEVVNQRHGSPQRPRRHETLDEKSPLAQVLEQFRSIRADLRFREDGVHTVLTVERGRAKR